MTEFSSAIANSIFLFMVVGIPALAARKRVPVYDTFILGAKDGLQVVIRIIPYLVAMLVAIGMLRASGAIDAMSQVLSPYLQAIGFPSEVLPLAIVRPFSGSAATGIMAELIKTHGGDSYISHLAATMVGSTETTFYVLAIYFGSVGIRYTRHAVPVGLIADAVGVIASVVICRFVFVG